MTIRTLRPNGTALNTVWTVSGAGSAHAATSDAWDGSYVRCPAFASTGETLKLDIADLTVPSGGSIANVTPYCRVTNGGLNHGCMLRLSGVDVVSINTSDSPGAPGTIQGATVSSRPGGGAWTQADINAFQFILTSSNSDWMDTYVYDLWVDVLVNDPPNTPTAPVQTSNPTVTTPTLGATVSSPDNRTVKARFELYQSDGTTLITTMDSGLVASGAQATATYGTPLALGQYKFRVKAIDSLGLESGWTSLIDFQILTAVSKDRTYLWNTLQLSGNKDLTALWNVIANNAKLFGFVWNVLVNSSKDLSFKWNLQTPWNEVNPDVGSEWGGKKPRDSDIWTTVEP